MNWNVNSELNMNRGDEIKSLLSVKLVITLITERINKTIRHS